MRAEGGLALSGLVAPDPPLLLPVRQLAADGEKQALAQIPAGKTEAGSPTSKAPWGPLHTDDFLALKG